MHTNFNPLIMEGIAGFQCHAIQNRSKEKIKTVQ